MRHLFTSPNRPKAVAKSLRSELAALGCRRSLTSAQELTARIYGYRNWKDLLANPVRDASPDDSLCDEETVAARRDGHTAVLVAEGLGREVAMALVDRIGPTAQGGGSRRRADGPDWSDRASAQRSIGSVAATLASLRSARFHYHAEGDWIGFTALFDPTDPWRNFTFAARADGLAFCHNPSRGSFEQAVGRGDWENSMEGDGRQEWSFLGFAATDRYPDRSGVSQSYGFLEAIRESREREKRDSYDADAGSPPDTALIAEVLGRLKPEVMVALRCVADVRTSDYVALLRNPGAVEFLHRYPLLGVHVAFGLASDRRHRTEERAFALMEAGSHDEALLLMADAEMPLTGRARENAGAMLPSFSRLAMAGHGDFFTPAGISLMLEAGPGSVPDGQAEFDELCNFADASKMTAGSHGIDLRRIVDGFGGSWRDHLADTEGRNYSLLHWSDQVAWVLCGGFAHASGLEPWDVYNGTLTEALKIRLAPLCMSRKSLLEIASINRKLAEHEPGHYPDAAECDRLASLAFAAFPEEFEGAGCMSGLELLGYDLHVLEDALQDVDAPFDDDGLPLVEPDDRPSA